MKIEMPRKTLGVEKDAARSVGSRRSPLRACGLGFKTIGDFYAEIKRGFNMLASQMNKVDLFRVKSDHQIASANWRGGGGRVLAIEGIDDANEAIDLISEQGEGYGGGIKNSENELAHYYRFKQLQNQQYYSDNDCPDSPTGGPLAIDYDGVHPILENPQYSHYVHSPQLYTAVVEFARSYRDMLIVLNDAFSGDKSAIAKAPAHMSSIRDGMKAIVRCPVPGHERVHAGPIFALPDTPGG